MNKTIFYRFIIIVILSHTPGLLAAQELNITDLIRGSLESNPDVTAAEADEISQYSRYQADLKNALPGIEFTTDTGNNPLYSYSNASKVERHKTSGGLNLSYNLPTGGTLGLSGTGSLDVSRAEGDEQWEYRINPGASLYLRQPLFIDRVEGSLLRADLSNMAEELSRIKWEQAEYNRLSAENRIVFQVLQGSLTYNRLKRTYDLQKRRLALAESRLELIIQDEAAGKISRIDRIAEELLLRRQREGVLELQYQIKSSARELENLTGLKDITGPEILFEGSPNLDTPSVRADESIGVLLSEAAKRSLEIAGIAVQNGREPVLEVSGFIKNSPGEGFPDDGSPDFQTAFDTTLNSEIDLSVSLALSIPLLDWGRAAKTREAEAAAIEASAMRVEAAKGGAELQILSVLERIDLIDDKLKLLESGLEYDRSLIEREQVRRASGLSSDLEVETVSIDMQDRINQIDQLEGEKLLAKMELLNIGGKSLKVFFR